MNCRCELPVCACVEFSDRTRHWCPYQACKPTSTPQRPGFDRTIRAPAAAQRSGCGGKRRSGGASDFSPFAVEMSDTELATTQSRRKPCRSFGGRAVTSARSAARRLGCSALRGSSASGAGASIARGCPPRTSPPSAADLRAEARTHCLVAKFVLGTPTEKGKEIRRRKKTESGT